MIAWLNPGALPLVALAALPIVIHLLLRRRATVVPFPTVRFIAPSDRSAMRLRRPSDVLLLAIRIAIVSCAAIAVARPLLLSDGRRQAWAARTIRAIVVDTSASVDASRASETATAEQRDAVRSRRFDAAPLSDGIARATAWLSNAEPGQREIVVISDFQQGTLGAQAFAAVPKEIGLRMVPVGNGRRADVIFEVAPVFHEGETWARSVTADETSTTATLRPASTSGLTLRIEGQPRARLMAAISTAGGVAPAADQPIEVRFGAIPEPSAVAPWPKDGWMRDTARRLFASPLPAGIAVRASAGDHTLVVGVGTPADSLAAAQVTQAALNARLDREVMTEREPARMSADVLATWTRAPGPPGEDAWPRSRDSDGRWLWLVVLALMGLETYVRRARQATAVVTEAHAA